MQVISLKGKKHECGNSLQHVPPNMTYIGRHMHMGGWKLSESKWKNPFKVVGANRAECLAKYEAYIRGTPELLDALGELDGHTLACWCSPEGCHGDVLIKLVGEFRK